MSNRELRPSSEEALEPLKEEELSAEVLSSTRSSWFGSSNEDKENRPPTNADTQQVLPVWDSDDSWTWDTERVEYGGDPVKLQKALKKATRKMDDIDDKRRRWYGEDADEAMQYQFRFTPEEIRNRAAERHGGQTFYEYMVSIGKALDLNRIVGDESKTKATTEREQGQSPRRRLKRLIVGIKVTMKTAVEQGQRIERD
ncbi:hypothetical protein ZTR_07405 [Talaromyces verruculosus]|nr:hypothetical protein ZTR_07405 [Talaromyces verruculosus]